MTCNCSTSGANTFDCPSVTSGLTWDGGSLCNGFSSGNLNDALHSLAQSICAIENSLSTLTYETDDITISSHTASCYTTTSGLLTLWMEETETKVCDLITDLAALDFTAPVFFDETPNIITTSPGLVVSDTIVIGANTINEQYEYLKAEVWGSVAVMQTGESKLRISFMGEDIDFIFSASLMRKPFFKKMKVEVNFRRGASNTAMYYDYKANSLLWGSSSLYGDCDYTWTAIGSTVSPIDWTSANNLVISAHNSTGNFTVERIVVTKFNIN